MKNPQEKQAFQVGDKVQCYRTGKISKVEVDNFDKEKLSYSVNFHDDRGNEVGYGTFKVAALESPQVTEAVTE